MKKYYLLIALFVSFIQPAISQRSISVAFYNVENLFDTLNNKKTDDEDFTPKGKLKWNTQKYFSKLEHISKVIKEMNDRLAPDVIGMAEVENKNVLKDLVSMPLLKPESYNIVHFESPDERGIDVALLFKGKFFKQVDAKKIRIRFPDDPKDKTRDILLVTLVKDRKDTLHFIVNHFPSRKGGTEASEPKRMYVASKVREVYDSLLRVNYKAKVLLMGDFNDEPDNKSIKEVLNCKYKKSGLSWNDIYNPMMDIKDKGEGTLFYRKHFELIDQFMLSAALTSDNNRIHYINGSVAIFKPEWLQQTDEAYQGAPFPTFGGPKYLNGYSDHFPISIKIAY